MSTITGHTTRAVGTILTAAIYNADHVNHVTNATNLNVDKIEAAAGPVVDGHAVLFNGTTGGSFKTAGYVPANKAGDTFGGNVSLTFANPRVTATNNSGVTTAAQLGADSGVAFVGTTTNHDLDLFANAASRAKVLAAGGMTIGGNVAWHQGNIGTQHNLLTEDTTPDLAADFLLSYDVSAAAAKKVLLNKLSPPPAVIVDRAYAEYTTNATLSTTIPLDDTIPTNTEGTEILSVAITPNTTTNRIRAIVSLSAGGIAGASCNTGSPIVAVFRGSTCIYASRFGDSNIGGTSFSPVSSIVVEDVPGSTSSQTYSVRVGMDTASGLGLRLNGSATVRQFGGVSKCTLVLEEITA